MRLYGILLRSPRFDEGSRTSWHARPTTELHATKDAEAYFTGDDSDWPVYNHLNIGHFRFDPSAGAFNHTDFEHAVQMLQAKRRRTWGNQSSPFTVMPRIWADDPGTLPALNPRIAFRDVVHSGNPRKVWAALVPAKTVLTNTAPYLIFPEGGLKAQAFLLAILNSSILDWLGHSKINLHLNYFILNSLPIPDRPDDERGQRLCALAAGLALRSDDRDLYGDWPDLAAPIPDGDRNVAVAELDAIASHLYGVPDHLIDVVWDRPTRPNPSDIRRFRDSWT